MCNELADPIDTIYAKAHSARLHQWQLKPYQLVSIRSKWEFELNLLRQQL